MNEQFARVQEVALAFGYHGQQVSNDVGIFRRSPTAAATAADLHKHFPVVLEVFFNSGDVACYLPHPRQKVYRLFHFNALCSNDSLRQIFQTPWSDAQFCYRVSDVLSDPRSAVPLTIAPPADEQMALQRQLTVVDREIADLETERADLARRLRRINNVDGHNKSEERSKTSLYASAHDLASDRRGAVDKTLLSFNEEVRANSAPKHVMSRQDERMAISGDEENAIANHQRLEGLSFGRQQRSSYSDRNRSVDRTTGNRAIWSMLFADMEEQLQRAWTLKPAAFVSLGRGYVMGYDDGSVTWCDICPLLESKLRQQGLASLSTLSLSSRLPQSPQARRIRYLVLGAESNFYVKFDNGRMEWCGQDSFGEALRRGVNQQRLLVDKVAFGQNGAWLIIWSDGSYESEGMPLALNERLHRQKPRDGLNNVGQGGQFGESGGISTAAIVSPRLSVAESGNGQEVLTTKYSSGTASAVKDVTVGPSGEWFIIYKDHSVQADNLPDSLYRTLSHVREKAGRVRSITFGEKRSWFVRYWDGLARYTS